MAPPTAAPANGATPNGAAAAPVSAPAVPLQPPVRYRPDGSVPAGAGTGPPTITEPEPAPVTVAPAPPPSRWGWRALAAFVAGGVLAAGGFGAAQLAAREDSGGSSATTTPAGGSIDPTSVEADPSEPAAVVAEVLGPSVVQIETDFGTGSGVVYRDGLIITNHHVVDGAATIQVLLSDGRLVPGQLLGSDPNNDVGVVKVPDDIPLPVAQLATEKARVGQVAVAIGSPFRLQQSVTEGIVSAVDRPVPSGELYVAMIQTDAPINPGNSGGALADRAGRVIGINTAIQTGGTTNTNAGVGFAIPIDTAVRVADLIVAGQPIEAGFLGVGGGPTDDGSSGVQVTDVTAGSAAELAGIQPGDHILSIDGAPVTTFEELAGLVVAHPPDEVVDIEVIRNGQPLTLTATLGRRDG
ncbi:MAG: S1C family serine protease [Acidimicrobiales bacterium]